jgi:hypothetical protein
VLGGDPQVLPTGPPVNHAAIITRSRRTHQHREKERVAESAPYVIEDRDDLPAEKLFFDGREQVVVAVRITPVYGQVDLGLLAEVVDEANGRGFTLVREQLFRDEWLLCVFEAYEEADLRS